MRETLETIAVIVGVIVAVSKETRAWLERKEKNDHSKAREKAKK